MQDSDSAVSDGLRTSEPAAGDQTSEDSLGGAGETVTELTSSALDKVASIWNWSFPIGETRISVSQVVTALLVFLIGYVVARLISRRVGGVSMKRLRVDRGVAAALQTITFYVLLAIVVFSAASVADVPLTVFTVLGGALALGVGFGSQAIINNFISGLIVLIERPIAVGDLVTIDGETGTVTKIAARATHVEDYLGGINIIPNSHVLENRVTNWNRPTPKVRSKITVGVAYGSDTSKVRGLIERAIQEHPRVIDSQPNQVLFTDFGDSALSFQAHFWTAPSGTLDKLTIESDVRYRINELFRENNIEIPFPQRDTNIRTPESIEVRVRQAEEG